MTSLIDYIHSSVIGHGHSVHTPFGGKPLIYADYTASGRSLAFIEDFIRERVLPVYANTHSEASYTGTQTNSLRNQAKQIIRTAINASDEDALIFCGSGTTAAVNRLIDMMNLRVPNELAERYGMLSCIPEEERPVVFIGPYEHHSNELPWRVSIADIVVIPSDSRGQIDLLELKQALNKYSSRPLRIGSFSAASNVTGIKTDVPAVTRILKQSNALAFWDYAAAAPYVGIDMSAEFSPDAAFVSPHKFIGGPGTPGMLVVKRHVLRNSVPAVVGGGTVDYVTPEDHSFTTDAERREEGGTPAIVESIRAGLVFKLQQDVGLEEIERLEQSYISRAIERLSKCQNLEILGNTQVPRLSILSLRFKLGEMDLHHGFISALMNDVFGIQVRGGCSCAGPYGHQLLGLPPKYSRSLRREIEQGAMIMRPGWVRLNFNYFISEEEFEYILSALELLAQHAWKLLPEYTFDASSGTWKNAQASTEHSVCLTSLNWSETKNRPQQPSGKLLADYIAEAEKVFDKVNMENVLCEIELPSSCEQLRWFALPKDSVAHYHAVTAISVTESGKLTGSSRSIR